MKSWGAGCAALACALIGPAAADAATLVNSNGLLTYTADTGESNHPGFYDSNGRVQFIEHSGTRVLTIGCTPDFTCDGVTSVVVNLGDGDDTLRAQSLSAPATVNGGPGDETFLVDQNDTVDGGDGIDIAFLARPAGGTMQLSLDGVPDPEGGNLATDLEDVTVNTPAVVSGNANANRLEGSSGDDVLTGGAGSDILNGNGGNDVLDALDGRPDRLSCGAGADIAVADQFDLVADDCETVRRETRADALQDLPPVVAWRAGAALAVDATDDRGVTSVRFLDGDRTLCTATTAPFTCAFAPRIADVGRKTLVAIATDTAGQTTSATRAITVPKFKPTKVSLTVRGRVASGKVTLPAGVPCSGKVRVGERTTTLRQNCTYRVRVRSAKRYVATYQGTTAIESKRSIARRPR